MDALAVFDLMFAHMEWADAAIWRAAFGSEAARADTGLHDRLHHVHIVQYAFLSVWQGVPMDPRAAESCDAAQLLSWARANHAELSRFVGSLDPARLDEPMPMPWAERAAERLGRASAAPTSIAETMIQVMAHSTYHRGQAATRLRELGVQPPLTDFIAWTWLGKPAPEWPGC